jgi:hypothetical protein
MKASVSGINAPEIRPEAQELRSLFTSSEVAKYTKLYAMFCYIAL